MNGGLNWYEQTSNVNQRLNAIFLINEQKGFIVGQGVIFYILLMVVKNGLYKSSGGVFFLTYNLLIL
ncbi:MAG: hypothetical protein R3A12_14600 [Ignavibacteria bacterium]